MYLVYDHVLKNDSSDIVDSNRDYTPTPHGTLSYILFSFILVEVYLVKHSILVLFVDPCSVLKPLYLLLTHLHGLIHSHQIKSTFLHTARNAWCVEFFIMYSG